MKHLSNCCGAPFYEPGWPDNDMCSKCKEHAGSQREENIASINEGIRDLRIKILQLQSMETDLNKGSTPSERWMFLDDAEHDLYMALQSNEHYH